MLVDHTHSSIINPHVQLEVIADAQHTSKVLVN